MRLLVLFVVLLPAAASAEPRDVKPNHDWAGRVRGVALKKEAPAGRVIADAKTFAKVWKAWRRDEKVPEIDFRKEIVVLSYGVGPNRPYITARLKDGKLAVTVQQDELSGPGFGYSLATFDRKGIKQVNGEKVP